MDVKNIFYTMYPNEKEKMVRSVETVEQSIDDSTGVVYLKRIATCANIFPSILRQFRVMQISDILLEEEAWIDHNQRMMKIRSRNITWSNYAKGWEESVFKPHKHNCDWTMIEQKGGVNFCSLGPFSKILEVFTRGFVERAVKKSLRVMDELLEEKVKGQ
ncbi:PRELI domain-containing protein 2-like isoform X2 [Ptychodera flava]|uniref:PRELI domain-containing protein 2-like isoform X2 n=1 Tax=Ptychodera flava TaxID=63121 RepID=UPI003969E221